MLLSTLEQFSFNVSSTPSALYTTLLYLFSISKFGSFETIIGLKSIFEFFTFYFIYENVFKFFINSRFDRLSFVFIGSFSLILALNLLGTFTFAFSFTGINFISSLAAFSLVFWTSLTAFSRFSFNFFSLLAPIGTPGFLAKSLIIIEAISYLGRFISINIRLFINILSGHLVLKLLYSSLFLFFSSSNFSALSLVSLISLLILTISIFALEVFIATLQAYIFFFLLCIYLKDCLW